MESILVFSLRNSLGDSTANGVTANHKALILFSADTTNEEIEKYCIEKNQSTEKCLRVVNFQNPIFMSYVEVVFGKCKSKGTYMAGGNFIYTSDSNYSKVTGVGYPLSVHDRFEPWEEYEGLSK